MKPIPIQNLDEDARRFMARVASLATRDAYDIVCTDFLTPREERLCYAAAAREGEAVRLFFFGGGRGAERRCGVFLPEWFLGEERASDPFGAAREEFLFSLAESGAIDLTPFVAAVSLTASEYVTLSHRDWLGALLALGIERSAVGDIAVLDGHRAIAFVKRSIALFVVETLRRVGTDGVRAAITEVPAGFSVPRAFESVEASIASPRMDGVVRALTGLSRADAADLVKSGEAQLNYFPVADPDAPVDDGDVLSLRGYGKYIIDSVNTVTRRGRNRLVARKYK